MSRIIRWIVEEPLDWADALAALTPGRIGRVLRRFWMARRLKGLGRRATIGTGLRISGGANISLGDDFAILDAGRLDAIGGSITIGNRVSCNFNVCIDAADGGDIRIGDDVMIGPNTVLRASNHAFSRTDISIRDQGHTGGTIVVEKGVWIGANCSILPGVRVGSDSIVGAGAVVTRNVDSRSIVGGSPAREIAKRQ